MAITVKNNRLLIDGKDVGDVLSSCVNYVGRLHEISEAAKADRDEERQQYADAQAALIEKHNAEIGDMIARHAEEVSAVQGQLETAKAQVEALGGGELAQKLAREKEIAELQRVHADTAARLALLAGDDGAVSTVGADEVKLG